MKKFGFFLYTRSGYKRNYFDSAYNVAYGKEAAMIKSASPVTWKTNI